MAPGEGGYRQINKALNICAFEEYLESQQKTLPTLPDVEQFTLQGTNTFIVGTGSERLLVDTGQGIPDWADLIHDTLARHGISLSHVLLTHWHGDHTGGVPDLIRMYPHLASAIYKHTPSKTQQPIVDGQLFVVEGATVRALHTPGHSSDHMCFILEEEQAMFTGDNILGHGTSAVEHLSTWMDTLYKMQSEDCVKGYPAHGIVISDLRIKIKGELAQKLQRERQVLKALVRAKHEERARQGRSNGSVTVKQLVTTMYGNGVGAGVRELALEPFIDEVLRKLAEDGAVAFEIRAGVRKWFALETV
ncbi:beta-lactamase-like protein 2 [Aspergillus udagawae]|uniref:Beta-lactamase-like protein 2 n=1 Tax=Aspergillus udagawae TaxID=91492 RepID=A0A8H3SIU6_9EURO|nr:beta-lactamase-like protein 2 [Aspergillus udagawae]GFF63003.1 beta-lactamase-like protein 2 [Aspergillus udagawae]GFG01173.1 beta-lactamase-like protein 2 [Aspergillus udagawae]